ncbi:hypothetical protein [Anaerostipes caccae]|uniref:hypothetical protein n=1 Tax=Anaerostipes caccae TaxID=105841 RepID=UPI00101CB9AF|nr:hypothetical protein [Anaerostipes caccae]
MKKSDIGFKLIMTVVWGFAGWAVWCLGSMIRIAAAPYSFFRFFDYLIAGAFILAVLTVWSEKLKKKRKSVHLFTCCLVQRLLLVEH